MKVDTQHTCKHCGDTIERWSCPTCGRITNQCKLCHDELVHDKIVPQFIKPQFGGVYGPTDDTSPAWDNAVRRMEDGQ